MMGIGSEIRRIRREQNISIEGLSLETGIAIQTISNIETGKTNPSYHTYNRLLSALGYRIEVVKDMRTRDCDTCVHHTAKGCESWKCDYINVDDAIKAFKRIDGINLVFCNECKHCSWRGEEPSRYLYCKQWKTMTEEYGHCHKGEER